MVISIQVTKESEKFPEIVRLYRAAFPREERVALDLLLETDGPYDFIACYDGEMLCGFYSTLTIGDITHVLFLAVEETLRGNGYGSQILDAIRRTYPDKRLILDVEMPDPEAENQEQRTKRIAFYERNGYHNSGVSYGWRGVMYEILILNGEISEEEFWTFWDQLDEIQQANYYFYTGSYAEKGEPGICLWKLSTRSERLSMLKADTQTIRPSWITLNERGDTLYAVREETPGGGVYELKTLRASENPEQPTGNGTALLRLIRELPSGGADPCHLSLDGREQFLMVANYSSGSLGVISLDEQGHLQELADLRQHAGTGADPERQEGPHVHFSEEAGEWLWCTDLGLDQVFACTIDYERGRLTDCGIHLQLPAGYGPRHLAFWHEDMEVIYVLCELASRVVVFAEKKAEGKRSKPEYVMLQDISTLPTGFSGANTASAIRLYGGFLFVGNRGDDSIAMYEIAEDGSLRFCSIEKTGGKTPRDFQIFSDFLVVANQDSDSLTVLHINREKKRLEKTAIRADAVRPTCICKLWENL